MNQIVHVIHGLDIRVFLSLQHFVGNPLFDRLASHEEANNLLKGGVFLAAFWYLWFRADAGRDERRKGIVTIVIAAALAIVVTRMVAFIAPFRVRPLYDASLPHAAYSFPIHMNMENWSSFPSDTAAYFFALAFGVAYYLRRLAIPILLYTAAWICLPRMYLGIHYASDIVVGGAIGISVAWLCLQSHVLRSLVAGPALSAVDAKPQFFYPLAFLLCFEMATIFAGLRDAGRAVVNVALVELHVSCIRSGAARPIDVWGGLLAIISLGGAGYLTRWLYRKAHAAHKLGANVGSSMSASPHRS